MLVPNKITFLKETTIYKSIFIVELIQNEMSTVDKIYNNLKGKFIDKIQFIDALTVLWLLNIIEFNEETGEVEYVKENN